MKRWKGWVLALSVALANCGGGGGDTPAPAAPATPMAWGADSGTAASATWDAVTWQ